MLKPIPGHWGEEIKNQMQRLEWALELLQEQRNAHIRRLQQRKDARVSAAQPDIQFFDDDMREIMNSWRSNPRMWMKVHNLAILDSLWGSPRHDFVKSRFGAMKFHLLGNEALVDYIIRYNLCGAAQPAALREFCEFWRRYTLTDQYEKAKRASEKQEAGHVRKAKQIWILKQKINRGKWIADWIAEARTNWYRLKASDKDLYADYAANTFHDQLRDVLRTPAGARNPGAGSNITRMR